MEVPQGVEDAGQFGMELTIRADCQDRLPQDGDTKVVEPEPGRLRT